MSEQAPTPTAAHLSETVIRYMAESMAMDKPTEDQEQNWIFGHFVTLLTRETETLRAQKVVAQHGRTLELMSRGSAAVELENKLREQIAVAELRAEAAEAQATARAEAAFKAGYHCRWHKGFGAYCFDPAMSPGDPEGAYAAWLLSAPALDAQSSALGSRSLEEQKTKEDKDNASRTGEPVTLPSARATASTDTKG